MRIVFMGTPAFAADILQGLIESHHEVVGLRSEPFKLGFPYMNSRL